MVVGYVYGYLWIVLIIGRHLL